MTEAASAGVPRVSVLLPARDSAATLASALRSVARQTFRDFECVVVDDASTDATGTIARAVAAADARFRLVPGPGNGIVAALQAGLAACRGALIARMDADDAMHRRRLALQVAALDGAPELAGVGCRVRLFPTAALGDGMRRYGAWLRSVATPADVRREALVECPLPHPTWLFRGDVLRAAGYRDQGGPEDYELLLRLLAAGREFAVVPRTLHAWRRGTATLSAADPRYAQERFTDVKAAHLAATFLATQREYALWGHGGTGRALRKALAAHGRTPAAIVELHPRRLGRTIHGAPVIPPSELPRAAPLPLVVSVAGAAARAEIRAFLAGIGRAELRDFVVAA